MYLQEVSFKKTTTIKNFYKIVSDLSQQVVENDDNFFENLYSGWATYTLCNIFEQHARRSLDR